MKIINNTKKDVCLILFSTASIKNLSSTTDLENLTGLGNLKSINSASTNRRNIIGIEISNATDEQKTATGCPEGGIYVTAIIAGHSASNAGVKCGDIISEVNSTPVKEVPEFLMALNDLDASRKYPFKICRKTQEKTEILQINILIEKSQEEEIVKIS